MSQGQGGGRPPYTEEQKEQFKARYIELLTEGKNEREIDSIDDMPCYATRSQWTNDEKFLLQVRTARSKGQHVKVGEVDKLVDDTIKKIQEGEKISPELARFVSLKQKNTAWIASRLSDDYKDKTNIEHSGGVERKFSDEDRKILEDFKNSD